MKTFTKMAAQGDFVIVRINQLPDNIEPVSQRNGFIVIAHSETGHDHLMLADRVEAYKPANVKDADLYEMFLKVEEPAKRKAGIKVKTVAELVEKLKNEAGVI